MVFLGRRLALGAEVIGVSGLSRRSRRIKLGFPTCTCAYSHSSCCFVSWETRFITPASSGAKMFRFSSYIAGLIINDDDYWMHSIVESDDNR